MRSDVLRHCAKPCQVNCSGCLLVSLDQLKAVKRLSKLGSGRLLAKSCGLSILQTTKLGHPFQKADSPLQFSSEKLSKISIVLFRCPQLGCLRVAFLNQKRRVLVYLSFEHLPWDFPQVDQVKADLQTCSLSGPTCLNHCSLWLDDWSHEPPRPSHSFDAIDLLSFVSECDWINVCLFRREVIVRTSLRPFYVDFDQTVLRLADRERDHIIYADMARVDFAFQRSSLIISSLDDNLALMTRNRTSAHS